MKTPQTIHLWKFAIYVVCLSMALLFVGCKSLDRSLISSSQSPTQLISPTEKANPQQTTFSNDLLKISFSIPSDWSVDPFVSHDKKFSGEVIALRPVSSKGVQPSKIEITIQSFEIDPTQSLLDWQRDILKLSESVNTSDFVLKDISSLALQQHFGMNNVAHIEMVNGTTNITSQLVLIRHGRLVYIINAVAFNPSIQPVLDVLAVSLRFADHAPNTLQELFGVDHSFPSSHKVIQTLQSHQGETECDIVCRDAKESERILPKESGN